IMAEEAKPKATVKSVNLKPEEAKAAAPAKKPAAKKTSAAKKTAAPKTDVKAVAEKAEAKAAEVTAKVEKDVKKAAAKVAKKTAAPKTEVSVQFDGKTYTTETLIQSAKDVWKYDLKKDPADLKSIQLYVKTEESRVYYVMDGELGSFEI
ncbi:MAG: DUF6465 family protein, partial [Lachnospiraceae bacterium]|nr:DUF6465 family protein [Lachnospiraceae bacterium]